MTNPNRKRPASAADSSFIVDAALTGVPEDRPDYADAEERWTREQGFSMTVAEALDAIERDRREPDKVLLNLASLRRALRDGATALAREMYSAGQGGRDGDRILDGFLNRTLGDER